MRREPLQSNDCWRRWPAIARRSVATMSEILRTHFTLYLILGETMEEAQREGKRARYVEIHIARNPA